jgi:hypothetical protein
LVVAATKEGLSADNIDHSRRLFQTVVPGNGSRAVQHRRIRLPWNADEPDMFAAMVISWIQGKALPDGFVDI